MPPGMGMTPRAAWQGGAGGSINYSSSSPGTYGGPPGSNGPPGPGTPIMPSPQDSSNSGKNSRCKKTSTRLYNLGTFFVDFFFLHNVNIVKFALLFTFHLILVSILIYFILLSLWLCSVIRLSVCVCRTLYLCISK